MKRLLFFLVLFFVSIHAQVTSYGTLITDPEDYFITRIPTKLAVNLSFIENFTSELMFFKIGNYTWRLSPGERRYFPRLRIPVNEKKDPQHKPIEFLSEDKEVVAVLKIKYETKPGRYFATVTLEDAQGNIMVRRHEYSPMVFNEIDLAIIISNPGMQFTIQKLTRARLMR